MKEHTLAETEKRIEDEKLSDLDKMRLDYTWKWFDFHAKQRMQLFNFFLIITGILASAYASAYDKKLYTMSFAVRLIGTLQAFGFFVFDLRSRELTRYAEDILEKLEKDRLSPHDFSDPKINKGQTLGLVQRECISKMREGNERGWKNLRKMKVWIRSIQIIVGLAFFAGLLFAAFQIVTRDTATPAPSTPNQEITPSISAIRGVSTKVNSQLIQREE